MMAGLPNLPPADLRFVIKEELRIAPYDKIRLATDMEVAELARQLGISRKDADAMRRAARQYVIERWTFQDAAGERE